MSNPPTPAPDLPPREALSRLAAGRHPFLLESSALDERFGRRSFAGADPFLTLTTRGRRAEIRRGDALTVREGDPLEAVREVLALRSVEAGAWPTPLPAGAVGFFSYDLGRRLERLPSVAVDDLGLPDIFLGLYDAVLTYDHDRGTAFVTAPTDPRAGEALLELLEGAAAPPCTAPAPGSALRSTCTGEAYEAMVARAREWIAAGDIYQVNLSQRFELSAEAANSRTGIDVYRRLAEVNPAPFAAYLESPCGARIVSASPERFLHVRGRRVTTCPIKGTRPRGESPATDQALAKELLGSEKDRAELTMIVDLMRNDLGRVARFGSLAVPEFLGLTSHPTVHHLNGTVVAELAEERDRVDLLRSCFPPGSITGAPKIRAMEIIEESEPFRRGVYTGTIGYLSFSGEMDTSVAIRTLVQKDGRITFSVGGGIVIDSDPFDEYRETLDKGRGIARALGYSL